MAEITPVTIARVGVDLCKRVFAINAVDRASHVQQTRPVWSKGMELRLA